MRTHSSVSKVETWLSRNPVKFHFFWSSLQSNNIGGQVCGSVRDVVSTPELFDRHFVSFPETCRTVPICSHLSLTRWRHQQTSLPTPNLFCGAEELGYWRHSENCAAPESSISCSQNLDNGLHPEPDESNPLAAALFLPYSFHACRKASINFGEIQYEKIFRLVA
jgi:hypothetical protein